MKRTISHTKRNTILVLTAIFLFSSCSPEIRLTSSWTNHQARVKKSPAIMVMALGKPNSEIRKDIENRIVKILEKDGFHALPATALFDPGVTKRDSAEVVSILRKNNIDLLLTNAVLSWTENQRFIPGAIQGTDIAVPAGGTANPNVPFNNAAARDNNYFNYYNYYNYNSSYDSYRVIEAGPTPGTTVTDIYIVIESNLYDVSKPELIWHGLSASSTKDPTSWQINTFSRKVIEDIRKNNLLIK